MCSYKISAPMYTVAFQISSLPGVHVSPGVSECPTHTSWDCWGPTNSKGLPGANEAGDPCEAEEAGPSGKHMVFLSGEEEVAGVREEEEEDRGRKRRMKQRVGGRGRFRCCEEPY